MFCSYTILKLHSKQKFPSKALSRTMHKTNDNFSVGLNCSVFIELIVFLDTPIILAI